MEDHTLSTSLALLFGAAHAIEPGHGKTALFTYLASGKCTWREGVTIALSSSITHSLAVLIIAFLSHGLFSHIEDLNTQIITGLRFLSAFTICSIGIYIFLKKEKASCSHCEGHPHSHHDHQDSQGPHKKKSLMASGLLGFATGLIPCPSVIVAYLAGLSHGNSYLGFKTVVLFAIGMALSLISLVVLFSFGGKKFNHYLKDRSFPINWNKLQGLVFVFIGIFMVTYH